MYRGQETYAPCSNIESSYLKTLKFVGVFIKTDVDFEIRIQARIRSSKNKGRALYACSIIRKINSDKIA